MDISTWTLIKSSQSDKFRQWGSVEKLPPFQKMETSGECSNAQCPLKRARAHMRMNSF